MKTMLTAMLAILTLTGWSARVELKTAHARCTVETLGARILSYRVDGGEELLWNDDPVQLTSDEWAHGGIPVCWPNFGLDQHGKFHGFAWKREFAVVGRDESPSRSVATFELKTPEATLTYRVTLEDEELKLAMTTRNASNREFAFAEGLHPYFRVGERDQAVVSGFGDRAFAVTNAIDGVLPTPKGSCAVYRLADPVLNRTLSLYAENADEANVWNPGPEKNCPGVVPGDEWRRWVCIEPVCGLTRRVRLAPGGTHTLKFAIRPRKGAAVTGFAGRDPRYPDAAERAFKKPFKVMFVGAHPDDPECDFGLAAARFAAAGAKVTFVSVCNGDNGHQTMAPDALAARRYKETQASAEVFGIERYIVMGEHDCRVEPTVDLRQRVTRLIREFEPNLIVTHRTCDYHADHRAVGQVVQDSTYLLGVPLFAPETPVPEILPFVMYAGDSFSVPRPIRPDLVVDGEDVADTVARALACHESQLFEWLPPEFGVDPASVGHDETSRLDLVKRFAMAELRRENEQHKALITGLFGGETLRLVNVFELCEYSRPPCAAERAFLASLPGFKWVK